MALSLSEMKRGLDESTKGDGVDAAVQDVTPIASMGKRLDGRGFTDLRSMELHLTVLNRPDGSARWAVGRKTVVTAAAYGPLECPLRQQQIDKMFVSVSLVLHASLDPKVRSETSGRKSVEVLALEHHLAGTLSAIVRVEQYPRQWLKVAIHARSDQGSLRAAIANVAFAAVMDAGVEMNFMVAAVQVIRVVVDGRSETLLDPNSNEEAAAIESVVFVCKRDGNVVHSQYLPTERGLDVHHDSSTVHTLAGDACKTIAAVMGVAFRQREELQNY